MAHPLPLPAGCAEAETFSVIVIARLLKGWIRVLVSDRQRVAPWERFLRFLLLSPPMMLWLVVRWIWILFHLGVEDVATTRDGVRMRCSLRDMIQMFVYLFGSWEPDLAAYLRRRLMEGDVYVDVGANVGTFALLAAKSVGPNGRVCAIEASPRIADRLRRNLGMNGGLAASVEVIEAAAGSEEGVVTLFKGPTKNEGMTTSLPERGLAEEGSVRSAPVGELIDRATLGRARVIKIDVEGAEREVLAGLARSISDLNRTAEVIVEFSPHWWRASQPGVAEVLEPYQRAGFNVYIIENNYWPWRYLWPNDVAPPRRFRGDLQSITSRVDMVLSRVDAESL